MFENALLLKSKLSLQPQTSSGTVKNSKHQGVRQTLIPHMKFVSNILNASKELMSNNNIVNTNQSQSAINQSTLSNN